MKTTRYLPGRSRQGFSPGSGVWRSFVLCAFLVGALPDVVWPQLQVRRLGFPLLREEDLVRELVGSGVRFSDVRYEGSRAAAGTFRGGDGILGIDSGVVLSSGSVADVRGPNREDSTGSDNGLPGAADLTELAGDTTWDAAVLEFDFVPSHDTVYFSYVFASEEYNEFVNAGVNDSFGFFINGENCAIVNGGPVSVDTINAGSHGRGPIDILNRLFGRESGSRPGNNSDLFLNNDRYGNAALNTEMDGLTRVLTCKAAVRRERVNHARLAIADAGDRVYDSAVFLAAGSFSTQAPENLDERSVTHAGLDDGVAPIVPDRASVEPEAEVPEAPEGELAMKEAEERVEEEAGEPAGMDTEPQLPPPPPPPPPPVVPSLRLGPIPAVHFGELGRDGELAGELDLAAAEVSERPEVKLSTSYDVTGTVLEILTEDGWRALGREPLVASLAEDGPRAWPLRLRAGSCPADSGGPVSFDLYVEGPGAVRVAVPLKLRVTGEPWLVCWWPFLTLAVGLVCTAVIVHGYVTPSRFAPSLGVLLSPEEDTSEGFFHPIRAQRGTRSGFYRDARVFIRHDHRLSGRAAGALACLRAHGRQVRLRPVAGQTLWRCTADGEWERLPEGETVARFGVLFRDDLSNLFFEVRSSG